MNDTSPEALAEAIRDERMAFGEAVAIHFVQNCSVKPSVGLILICQFVIGFACMGMWDDAFDFPGGTKSVGDVIEEYRLQAFISQN